MNALSSIHTILFALLFATLLILTSAGETSNDDVEQRSAMDSEEYVTPDVVEKTNFWPPMHLRGLRSSNGKPTFIRFGKRASPSFIRFGRK